MKDKEPLSRRNFLVLGTILAAAGPLLYLERKPIGRLVTRALNPPQEHPENPMLDIENRIIVSQEGERERGIKVNRGAFATALIVLALDQDPKEGLQKLKDFMLTFPLEIRFANEDHAWVDKNSQLQLTAGQYYNILANGPAVEFFPAFLAEYKLAQKKGDPEILLRLDTAIFHEFVHFWQEIRNLLLNSFRSSIDGKLSLAEWLTSLPLYNYVKDPDEVEARQISEGLAKNLSSVAATQDTPWPFGKFFEYTD